MSFRNTAGSVAPATPVHPTPQCWAAVWGDEWSPPVQHGQGRLGSKMCHAGLKPFKPVLLQTHVGVVTC